MKKWKSEYRKYFIFVNVFIYMFWCFLLFMLLYMSIIISYKKYLYFNIHNESGIFWIVILTITIFMMSEWVSIHSCSNSFIIIALAFVFSFVLEKISVEKNQFHSLRPTSSSLRFIDVVPLKNDAATSTRFLIYHQRSISNIDV